MIKEGYSNAKISDITDIHPTTISSIRYGKTFISKNTSKVVERKLKEHIAEEEEGEVKSLLKYLSQAGYPLL